jgi:membrane protein DedA with SNARE-associated domain
LSPEELVNRLGYPGIWLILVLGGLGLPVPEEAPVILAAVLSRKGTMWWPYALTACFTGVLAGDFVVYFLGFFFGERVLKFPLTRRLLTKQRETQLKGYFHRHGFKILIMGRFAPGFRTAAYLTAGILKLPTLKLLFTDLLAASLSTGLMFGLAYAFASHIEKGVQEVQHWIVVLLAAGLSIWLLQRFIKARRRAGRIVGPPVLVDDEEPTLPTTVVPDEPPAPAPAAITEEEPLPLAFELFLAYQEHVAPEHVEIVNPSNGVNEPRPIPSPTVKVPE